MRVDMGQACGAHRWKALVEMVLRSTATSDLCVGGAIGDPHVPKSDAVFDELPFFNQRTDDSSHLALCETLDRMIQASNTPEQALSATLALCNVALHSRSAAALLRALHALLRAQATGVLDGAAAVPRTRCVRDLLGMLPTPTSCSVTRSPRIWHQP